MTRKNELECIRLFVAQMLNDGQSIHSKLIDDLRRKIGGTKQFDEIVETLTKIYDAKVEVLNKIYKEIQGV